jgi:hexokinase
MSADQFVLSLKQLADCAVNFADGISSGLSRDNEEIKALITYVGTQQPKTDGEILVVDLGGTRCRAVMVRACSGHLTLMGDPIVDDLPVVRGAPLPKATFLSTQVALAARTTKGHAACPLGYCFSYPATSRSDGDATLIRWTKEVFVPDTEGYPVGEPLREALQAHNISCSSVTVINDTVAALLAGLTDGYTDEILGLIVGTGTNLAIRIPPEDIPKFPSELSWADLVPVNLESGNFTPRCLNDMDNTLNDASDDPKHQRFEKAVSGAYLGRLLAAASPQSDFDPEDGSQGVVALAQSNREGAQIARTILVRSASLVAASLAGAIYRSGTAQRRVRVVAEGGLYWGAPGYADNVSKILAQLLQTLELSKVVCEVIQVPNANLLGTALAAANGEINFES